MTLFTGVVLEYQIKVICQPAYLSQFLCSSDCYNQVRVWLLYLPSLVADICRNCLETVLIACLFYLDKAVRYYFAEYGPKSLLLAMHTDSVYSANAIGLSVKHCASFPGVSNCEEGSSECPAADEAQDTTATATTSQRPCPGASCGSTQQATGTLQHRIDDIFHSLQCRCDLLSLYT